MNKTPLSIAVVGAGIVGACTAWALAKRGQHVTLIERDHPMAHTSSSTSKLLHGGLRYLETGQFGLVRKSLLARSTWLKQAPNLCKKLKFLLPVYQGQGRSKWILGTGLKMYDLLALGSGFKNSSWIPCNQILDYHPRLEPRNLLGAYSFFDVQMDDLALGNWVIDQAKAKGVSLIHGHEITALSNLSNYDRIVNATGPWAMGLRQNQPGKPAYSLDWVRGSHIVLDRLCPAALLLQVPEEKRIFFILPYRNKTLVGTTEVRQEGPHNQGASNEEINYLLNAYNQYLQPTASIMDISQVFSGVRPLIKSAKNPTQTTREWAFERVDNVLHIYGGKWTTAQIQGEEAAERILQ